MVGPARVSISMETPLHGGGGVEATPDGRGEASAARGVDSNGAKRDEFSPGKVLAEHLASHYPSNVLLRAAGLGQSGRFASCAVTNAAVALHVLQKVG